MFYLYQIIIYYASQTNLAIANGIMCRMDKHFKNPDEFIPERWMKSEKDLDFRHKSTTNPFVYLPFGFGQRSCIGKRFAYLELDVAVSKVSAIGSNRYHYSEV